jgi:hypothetical protein
MAVGVTLVLAAAGAGPLAQSATAPDVKAAFLYNFAKFTEWPSDVLTASAPLSLCVIDDAKLVRALEEATAGRDVEGHTLVVRKITFDGPVRSCHLLFANGLDAKRSTRLIETLKGAPVLAVSDLESFAIAGGTINFFLEDGRMRFAVNLEATQRARLRLSSKLLSLAKIVKDDSNVAQY